jgi:hypothetical protein
VAEAAAWVFSCWFIFHLTRLRQTGGGEDWTRQPLGTLFCDNQKKREGEQLVTNYARRRSSGTKLVLYAAKGDNCRLQQPGDALTDKS